ncbi:MAG: DcrB-related protein [Deltaproteobacteria bacterium]|nr:DcrB-related protein [Deltaproteobacteria bacterium]
MANYSIYGGSIALALPDNWDDRSIYTFVAPEQSMSAGLPTMAKTQGFRPNVVVTREHKGRHERVDAYAKEQLNAQKQTREMKNLTVVTEENITVSGAPAISRNFTFVVESQKATVQQLQVFVMHGTWIYTFTFSTLPAHFAEQKKMFDSVISAVKLA